MPPDKRAYARIGYDACGPGYPEHGASDFEPYRHTRLRHRGVVAFERPFDPASPEFPRWPTRIRHLEDVMGTEYYSMDPFQDGRIPVISTHRVIRDVYSMPWTYLQTAPVGDKDSTGNERIAVYCA